MATQVNTSAEKSDIVESIRPHMNVMQSSVDLDTLLDRIGHSRIVMLGEASHGTHEYYTWRSLLSQRLIREKGFNFIAVEGDWPDCYRVNRYVKRYAGSGTSAFEVLHSFNRWPTWMWGNWETVALAEWLNDHNRSLRPQMRAGFYGLDVYSLWESIEAILAYLRKVDPSAIAAAEKVFECFTSYQREEGRGYAGGSLMVPSACTHQVVHLLTAIRSKMPTYAADHENKFSAEQNAIVAVNADRYYRAMLSGGSASWNIRENHMMDTLERLLNFYGDDSKAIVWAHNTHIGDARATASRFEERHNLGELARKKYGEDEVSLVGFGSFGGTVIAANQWGANLQRMNLPSALPDSWEGVLNDTGIQNGYLMTRDLRGTDGLGFDLLHRGIGVVHSPSKEQSQTYVASLIPMQYDAFVFLKQTKGLHALSLAKDEGQMPQTYPFGV